MSKIETNVVKPQLKFTENLNDYSLIQSESEVKLDAKLKEIEDFINNNDGKGQSDEVKDALYNDAQKIWKEYSELLQETKYEFNLNESQLKFLKDLIVNKMQYDVDNILKEVGTLFLGRPLRAPEEQCPNRLKKMICRGEAMQT